MKYFIVFNVFAESAQPLNILFISTPLWKWMKKIPTVFLFTWHQTWTSYRWITKKVQIWISCHDFWSFLSQDKTTSNYWSRAISSAAKCETNNREISLKLRFERELDLRSLTYTSESRVVGSELIGSITGEEGQNSLTEDLSMLPSLSLMTIIILVFH